MEGEPGALYTNTNNARGVIEKGFKGAEYGKYSSYNWFSTTPNAGGTGRAGQGVTLTVEGINTSNSIEITSKQMKSFYEAAKQELGYTSEQLRNNPALRSEVDGLKYSKLGKWMDETGAAVYKLGDSYAVSDAAANKGTIKAMNGNSSLIKSLNGTKIAGRSLVVIAAGLDAYEIYTSENRARTITSVVGGWIGAWAGATLGAEGGAIIGAACGAPAAGVGAAPGAVVGAGIGSLIGGVAGYFVGREITETVYDLVTTSGFKIGGK